VNTVFTPVGPGALANPTAALTYNTIAGVADLTAILEALKAYGKTEIIAEPHVSVLDGQEAKIEVVEDQPYKEITLESGTTNVTGVTYLFKKVGVQLAVTPKINDRNFISVSIKPQISSITEWYNGAPQEGTPVVRISYAETTVMVKDGVTIIIGGMIKDHKSRKVSQVPFLGSIPLLGRLFQYEAVSSGKEETTVIMTPRIVTGDEYYPRQRDMKKEPKPLRSAGNQDEKRPKPVR
jgi:type IV pilus assembly protein PilQ